MKKVYLSFCATVIAMTAVAQNFSTGVVSRSVAKEIAPIDHSTAAGGTDTLGLDLFGSQLFLYYSPSGYVFGTNDLIDSVSIPGTTIHQLNYQYAAGFLANTEYNVLGAMMWFAAKADVSGSPADLKVRMYSIGDNQALSSGTSQSPDAPGPDQEMGSVNLPFANVDTASFNTPTFAFFANPIWTTEDFILSVDIKDLYGNPADTVALYADEDGASDGTMTFTEIGFDINPATLWARSTALLQGGLDVNLGIFAIVSESGTGIEEQGFLNGVKMTTYPNPAVSGDNLRIDYGLETVKEKVELNIYTLSGQQVFTAELGSKTAGLHSLTIPAGTLASGSYVYALEADGSRIAKRLEILK